jgi:O-antigen ligase
LTKEAWRLIETNPAGIGWGNFYFGGGIFSYPHNTYLEVAVEAGWIIGFVFAALCMVAAIRYLRLPPSPEWLVMFGLFVFAALNAAVSSNLTGNRLLIVALFAAFVLPVVSKPRVRG